MRAPPRQGCEVSHPSQGPLKGRQAVEVRGVRDPQALEQLQSQLRLEHAEKSQAFPVSAEEENINHRTNVTGLAGGVFLVVEGP